MSGPKPKLHLPFALWPKADQSLWQATTADDDPFGEAGGGRLAPTTLHTRWMAWRRYLGFLATSEPEVLKMPPSERITAPRIRRFTHHLSESMTAYSVACQIDALFGAARIMLPHQNWSWLRAVKARLFAMAPPKGATGPVITSMQLEELGIGLMKESQVEGRGSLSKENAVRYRDGLIVALMGHVPLRHKNFVALELGRSVLRQGDSWSIVIPPEDCKTKIELDFPVPEILQKSLSVYLELVRLRLLLRENCNALWVSAKGGQLSYSALGPIVTRHSTDRLGLRITPHDARDAAATTWAIHAPDKIGVARDLLGQSDLRTTTKYYNRAKGIEAARAHARLIAKIRKGGC